MLKNKPHLVKSDHNFRHSQPMNFSAHPHVVHKNIIRQTSFSLAKLYNYSDICILNHKNRSFLFRYRDKESKYNSSCKRRWLFNWEKGSCSSYALARWRVVFQSPSSYHAGRVPTHPSPDGSPVAMAGSHRGARLSHLLRWDTELHRGAAGPLEAAVPQLLHSGAQHGTQHTAHGLPLCRQVYWRFHARISQKERFHTINIWTYSKRHVICHYVV